jgi:hypothetical protein
MTTLSERKQRDHAIGTTYARAVREYDEQFKRDLISAITTTIFEASMVTDPELRVLAIRVGETIEALTTVMISFAAMSPQFDVPSDLRIFAENTAKRIRREVAKARAEGTFDRFGARKGGTA